MSRTSAALLTTLLCLTLCAGRAIATPLADAYVLDSSSGIPDAPARVPEGVTFDPVGADFYAGSVFGGRITAIAAHSGEERLFYQEADLGLAFVGMKVAPSRRVLWSCVIDRASTATAPISYVYALRIPRAGQGSLIRRFSLPVPFFCNDLALDAQGNLYITDSYGPALLRIPARALSDASVQAEPFAVSAALAPSIDPDGVVQSGMNGIAVTPDNRWLLVARGAPSQLVRVSLANPSDVRPVALSGDAFGLLTIAGAPRQLGPDGVVFADGALYVVFAAGVQRVSFGRAFEKGVVRTSSVAAFGLSTATLACGEVYAIDSEIHVLSPELGLPAELPHQLIRVPRQSFGR